MKHLTTKVGNLFKEHFYVFILLFLSLIFFHNIISTTKVMNNLHYISDVTFYSYNVKEALKYGTLPLWTPYYYSGRPLFAQPEYYFIDLNLFLIILTGNIFLAMNFSVIAYLFIAGLGMYFLVFYLTGKKTASFISALIYMFNGFVHTFVVPGNIMILEGYSLIPLIFLFTVKALKSKQYILNSVIAGLFVALQIFVGGVIFLPYLFLLIVIYSIIYLIDKNIAQRATKLFLVGIMIAAVGFGVSAVKLLPGIEFINLSNRGVGIPYQEYLGEPIKATNFGFAFISNIFFKPEHISTAVGIAGFLLLILGLSKIKNRIMLFSLIIIILSLLLSHESFLTRLFFKVPIFNQVRHVERSIFMFAFASSILAGSGYTALETLNERHKKINSKFLFSAVMLLIFAELFLLQKFPQSTGLAEPSKIPVLDYISKDNSKFRVINLVLNEVIGASGYNYYSQLGIDDLKGGGGIWFNDYINYLAVAQYAPAKFWGILNAKYIIHDKNISLDGITYVSKFRECLENCQVGNAFGPYLYKNEKFLPRYYLVQNSILVVGDDSEAKKLIYALMLQDFNPANTVIVQGTKINDYDADFLSKFDYIILGKNSIDDASTSKLRQYISQGGHLLPDILNGQTSLSNEDIAMIFNNIKGYYKEVSRDQYSTNKIALNLNGEKGWLVASERFAYFQGWSAKIDEKNVEIFQADNVISTIFLDGDKGKLVFEYKPNSYKKGKLISTITVIIIIIYFSYIIYNRKFKTGDKNKV